MRSFVLILALVTGGVVAQDTPYLMGEELKAAVERDCAEGCITFNRDEAKTLQDQLEALIARREKAAFEAGVSYQKQACRSLI